MKVMLENGKQKKAFKKISVASKNIPEHFII